LSSIGTESTLVRLGVKIVYGRSSRIGYDRHVFTIVNEIKIIQMISSEWR